MQLTIFSKLKLITHLERIFLLSVADILSRSFTDAELQINQHKHKQFSPLIDFTSKQNDTSKPVFYVTKHEELLPHQNMIHNLFLQIKAQINSLYV